MYPTFDVFNILVFSINSTFPQLFYRFHWIFFVAMIFAVAAHDAATFAIGVIFWLVDLVIRFGCVSVFSAQLIRENAQKEADRVRTCVLSLTPQI